jgi:hypothetical protein
MAMAAAASIQVAYRQCDVIDWSVLDDWIIINNGLVVNHWRCGCGFVGGLSS